MRDVGASPAATPIGATDLLTDFRALNGGAQPLGCTIIRMRGRVAAEVSAAPTFLTAMTIGAIVLPRTIPVADIPNRNLLHGLKAMSSRLKTRLRNSAKQKKMS